MKVFSTKRACPTCGTSYGEPDPRMFSYNSKHGWCPGCVGTGLALTREQRAAFDDSVLDENERGREQAFITKEPDAEELHDAACPDCHGARLAPAPRAIKFEDQAITDVAQWAVSDVRKWVESLQLGGRDADIARDVISEIRSRLVFLEDVGLNYLTLDRAAPTLSGGEAQRIRLAAQLGSNLQGVCYVLDEPTIGLHPRDNKILLDALARLGSQGNTLVVVEHDEDTIRRADHLIDIGPGAGKRGGRLVARARRPTCRPTPDSVTGRCLAHPQTHPMQPRREVAFAADDAGASTHITRLRRQAAQPAGHARARAAAAPGGRSPASAARARARIARDVLLASVADLVSSRGKARADGLRVGGGLALGRPRAGGRPDADRQDAALVPGHLHRLLGRHPQAVRRDAGGQGARLRGRPLQLQHRRRERRPLPGLRGPGRAHHRDELPARREGGAATCATARASTRRRWRSRGAARASATCCRWRSTRRWSSSPACRPSRIRCSCCRTWAWAT